MSANAHDILIAGIGGQGIVLASRLLAHAHMARGDAVRVAETIGMSQRGGSVVSHVRTAAPGHDVASSLIPLGSAELILAFEPGEAVRALPYLAPSGTVVTAIAAQRPITASLAKIAYDGHEAREHLRAVAPRYLEVDGETLTRQAGSPRCLNVVLLGAALGSGALELTADELRAAIRARVKPSFHAMNLLALDLGAATASEKADLHA